MSLFYLDQDIQGRVPHARMKQARTNNDSDKYQPGNIVEAWDTVFRWDEDCVSNAKMVEWRFRGDELADAALPVIMSAAGAEGGTDLFERLGTVVTDTSKSSSSTSLEAHALWRHFHTIDDGRFRYDRAQILRGQAVFYRFAPHILASLLQYSLSAGFSSPRISRVLNIGSYLVPPMSTTPEGEAPRITAASNDRTYMRLMETTQFVIDCMSEGAMEIGGNGWKAAIRVRLLHATMRQRILEKVRNDKQTKGQAPYDEARDGIPISQEDYSSTLTAFATAPLIALLKVGITPTAQDCEDYTALWKVIGYYLGIDEDILEHHFSSWHQSTRILGSVIANVFAGESDPPPPSYFPLERLVPKQDRVIHVTQKSVNPDPWTSPSTLPVIFSVCNRWPSPFTLLDHCAAARNLMGPSLADWLSVPRTSWMEWLKLHIGFAIGNIPPKFAQIYRSEWDARRRRAMQNSVEAAIIMTLGDRITKFRPRQLDAFEPQKEADEFSVKPDREVISAVREWGLVYAEMSVVLALIAPVLPLYAVQTTWGIAMQALKWTRLSQRQ